MLPGTWFSTDLPHHTGTVYLQYMYSITVYVPVQSVYSTVGIH